MHLSIIATLFCYLLFFSPAVDEVTCASNEYRCPPNGPCISGNRRCDGHPHCPGGQDEMDSVCGKYIAKWV